MMLTPALLVAYLALPVRHGMLQPPYGYVVMLAMPVPNAWLDQRQWIEPQLQKRT